MRAMDMTKQQAIALLGGTVTSAAAELGVTYQAVEKWPDVLPGRIADRVRGAWARKEVPHLIPVATDTSTQAEARRAVS